MNYYQILEVELDATGDEIKKSYRKLAMQYHPDKNDGDDVKFKQIQEAYDVLSDDNKRMEYDHIVSGRSFRGSGPSFNMSDIFNSFFRGGGNVYDFKTYQESSTNDDFDFANAHYNQNGKGGYRKPPKKTKGSDLRIKISITPEETITETKKRILYTRKVQCPSCKGVMNHLDVCDFCYGSGFINEDNELKIKIPVGCTVGTTTRLTGYGNQGSNGEFGDVLLVVDQIVSSDKFKVGPNYRIETEGYIDFIDALSGTMIKIDTLNGSIEYNLEPLQALSNNVIILENFGIPVQSGSVKKTPHIHVVSVEAPEMTDELKNKLKNIREYIYGDEPKRNSESDREPGVQGEFEEQEDSSIDT